MAIQTSYNKIKSDYIEKLVSTQVVVKATLDTSQENGVILGTSADARALAIEPMQGEVQINGKVNFKTIFSSAENGVVSLDYFADFTDTVKEENILPSSKLLLHLNVIDTDSTMSGQDIILTAVVEIVVEEIKSEESEALVNVGEGVFTKTENVNTQNLKMTAEGAFELYEEIEAGADIDKILVYDAQIAVNSVKCGNNILNVSGEANAAISFKSGENILMKNIVMPFTEEMDADGANENSIAMPELFIKNKRIILSGNKGDNIIRAEMVVGIKAPIFEKTENKVVSDIYSNEVNIETEEKKIKCVNIVKECCHKEKISAVANLNAGMKGVKSILSCCLSRNNLANLISMNKEVLAEGLMTACVLYLDEDNNPTSVRAELPYSLKLPDEEVKENDIINGYGTVYNVSARAENANEIEVKADIRLCISVSRQEYGKIITKINEGEKKDLKLNAVSIYIASGGEEMWDLVKYLSTSPEKIMEQNPDLKLPLNMGQKVKMYRTI